MSYRYINFGQCNPLQNALKHKTITVWCCSENGEARAAPHPHPTPGLAPRGTERAVSPLLKTQTPPQTYCAEPCSPVSRPVGVGTHRGRNEPEETA